MHTSAYIYSLNKSLLTIFTLINLTNKLIALIDHKRMADRGFFIAGVEQAEVVDTRLVIICIGDPALDSRRGQADKHHFIELTILFFHIFNIS